MTLQILICTCDGGITKIPSVITAPQKNVSYLVSFQYSSEFWLNKIPEELKNRPDVSIYTLQGLGLSRNRNNALRNADADICVLADDDVRFCASYFKNIINAFENHENWDVICFQAKTENGARMKVYPADEFEIKNLLQHYIPNSIEIAFRRIKKIQNVPFDERFGLGAELLESGEDVVWIRDLLEKNVKIGYVPKVITNSLNCIVKNQQQGNESFLRTKGALDYVLHRDDSYLRLLKFALRTTLFNRISFFRIVKYTFEGRKYIKGKRR